MNIYYIKISQFLFSKSVAQNKTTIYNNIIRNIVSLSMLPETHQMLHKTCRYLLLYIYNIFIFYFFFNINHNTIQCISYNKYYIIETLQKKN